MNPTRPSFRKCVSWLLLGAGVATSAPALAATYNIFLKSPGSLEPTACASGGFSFDKTAGTSTVTVTINTTNAGGCPLLPNSTYSGPLTVIVENVKIGGLEDQGPNVVGLSGTLPRTSGGGNTQVAFTYGPGTASTSSPSRPAAYTASNGTITIGAYHVSNTNAVPEPGAVWLVVPAVAGLIGLRARRKRG